MNRTNIQHFLDHQYIPFSKKQCIQRILLIWALSLVPVFVGKQAVTWAFVLSVPNIIIGILFIFLSLRYPRSRMARYLCDGVTFLQLSVLLMLSAYRIITFDRGKNVLLLLIITDDKYRPGSAKSGSAAIPYVFGAMGFTFAGVVLTGQSQKAALTVLAVCFMILSLLIGIGSLNLLKAYFSFRRIP